jgi:hypothetical protein
VVRFKLKLREEGNFWLILLIVLSVKGNLTHKTCMLTEASMEIAVPRDVAMSHLR